jgi:fatty-acyl-CoA synthase
LALPFTQVQAVAEDGRVCAPGETGVLRLRGPNVSPGYTDARRNAGTFTEDGWLISGDIGHVDAQGRIFVTGRAKDVIIRSSHNIDPGLIESALLKHPDVLMAAAVGAPDEYAGELPVAFVALRPGAQLDAKALSAFVEPHIPERPAVPKYIDVLPSIPMTAVGKVYKPALRAMAIERVIRERLEQAGLLNHVDAELVELPSGWQVRFTLRAGSARGEVEAGVRKVMAPFALAFEFHEGNAA